MKYYLVKVDDWWSGFSEELITVQISLKNNRKKHISVYFRDLLQKERFEASIIEPNYMVIKVLSFTPLQFQLDDWSESRRIFG